MPTSKSLDSIALRLLGLPWSYLCQQANHWIPLLWIYSGYLGATFAIEPITRFHCSGASGASFRLPSPTKTIEFDCFCGPWITKLIPYNPNRKPFFATLYLNTTNSGKLLTVFWFSLDSQSTPILQKEPECHLPVLPCFFSTSRQGCVQPTSQTLRQVRIELHSCRGSCWRARPANELTICEKCASFIGAGTCIFSITYIHLCLQAGGHKAKHVHVSQK